MSNQKWLKEIQDRIKKVPILSGHSNKLGRISWDDFVSIPAQLSKRPVDFFREEILTRTVLGIISS
jgi:hypothetical protein